MLTSPPGPPPVSAAAATMPPPAADEAALRAAAERFETAFLAEMLGHAGLAAPPGAFGGGPGEAQFASFLVHAQAESLVRAGGIGLAETIFNALKERADDTK